jgi:apolipoprotein N-acyltransferase
MTTPLFKDVVMTRTVPLLREMTVYARFGDVFAMACLAILLIFTASTCLFRRFRKYSG